MKTSDLIRTAIGNTFRSKARTILTVLAIFVGAFTLTLTSGIGTGVNQYIDDTVSSIGTDDVMTVTKPGDADGTLGDSGPREYDPDKVSTAITGATVSVMTDDDLEEIGTIDGVEKVQAVKRISADFIQHDGGKRFVASVGTLIPGQTLQLAAGEEPDNDVKDNQVVIPVEYVDALRFDDSDDAIGRTLSIAITDANYEQHVVEAEIVGVSEVTLAAPGGSGIVPNDALTTVLFDIQQDGLPDDQLHRWTQATVWFDADLTSDEIDDLKNRLADAGFSGVTTADRLGAFTTVIDTIILILNGFAIIALLAAGFGIVNTLLMSVQERTREIGLMKAMGMSSGRVFTLFSVEAAFIGFLGSVIGVIIAMVVGNVGNTVLADALLSDLPGLNLVAFDPVTVAGIILLIMLVAFLAGTLPAARAAGKDPVEALRYE